MNNKKIQKYFNNHSEPLSKIAKDIQFNHSYHHAISIPIYDEYQNTIKLLNNISNSNTWNNILIILVINEHEDTPKDIIDENQKLINFLLKNYKIYDYKKNLYLVTYNHKIDIAIFNLHDKHRLERSKAIGTARKIGCDFICQAIYYHQFPINWIHNTDADVNLPIDYFYQTNNISSNTTSACVYNFQHYIPDTHNFKLHQAIQLYENSLYTYVNGLTYAGSPYAFHTIGSLLAISPYFYIACRGFPKFNAAEDFYLLNKLAKIAPIKNLPGLPIKLQTRVSNRVPFGTGPALKRIISQDTQFIQNLNYPQSAFNDLKTIITHINTNKTKSLLNHPKIYSKLSKAGFFSAVSKIEKNNNHQLKQTEHIHHWFDALKTLKFIKSIIAE